MKKQLDKRAEEIIAKIQAETSKKKDGKVTKEGKQLHFFGLFMIHETRSSHIYRL